MKHLEECIKSFFKNNRIERYLTFTQKKKGIEKIRNELSHEFIANIKNEYLFLVPQKNQNIEDITNILKEKGASEKCFILSCNSKLNNKEIKLSEALLQTIGNSEGTLIFCLLGKLLYYEGEEYGERYIIYK